MALCCCGFGVRHRVPEPAMELPVVCFDRRQDQGLLLSWRFTPTLVERLRKKANFQAIYTREPARRLGRRQLDHRPGLGVHRR